MTSYAAVNSLDFTPNTPPDDLRRRIVDGLAAHGAGAMVDKDVIFGAAMAKARRLCDLSDVEFNTLLDEAQPIR